MKITEYPAVTGLADDNIVLLDGPDGTKKMTISDLRYALFNGIPQMHANLFRGKSLGTSFTTDQKSAVSGGTFDDIFVGDYWTIDNRVWRVADIDYYLETGDNIGGMTAHHLVIVPDDALYNQRFSATTGNNGGYVGSEMYKTGLDSAKTIINSAFPNSVLTYRINLINAVSNGEPSGHAWYDSTVDLMSEIMVYGHPHFMNMTHGTTIPATYTEAKTQLALFRLAPQYIVTHITNDEGARIRSGFWLRDPVGSYGFAAIDVHQDCEFRGSTGDGTTGVRPAFCIG